MMWQPATFTVRVMERGWERSGQICDYDKGWSEREGYVHDVFGLHHGTINPIDDGRSKWVVTHLPTGLAFATFGRRRDAERFVRLIEPLVDWGTVQGTPDDAIKDGVKAALARIAPRCR